MHEKLECLILAVILVAKALSSMADSEDTTVFIAYSVPAIILGAKDILWNPKHKPHGHLAHSSAAGNINKFKEIVV
jgi:hypothetical protein